MRREFAAFTALYFGLAWAQSRAKPLWFDELFTYYVSRLPSLAELRSALGSGPELNPPLHYLAARASMFLLGDSELALRLPFLIAFWVGCACVFLFVARRCRPVHALTAAAFPIVTTGFFYATEARPYGFLFGGCGIALVAWQRSAEENSQRWWPAGISLGLAVALLSHCYAVLLFLPLAAGELSRSWARRRIDQRIWLAMLITVPLVLAYVPLFQASRALSVHTPAVPTVLRLARSLALLPGLYAVVLAIALAAATGTGGQRSTLPRPRHEWHVALALALLPLAAFVLAWAFTGFYHLRYALPSLAGVSILLGFWLSGSTPASGWRPWLPVIAIGALGLTAAGFKLHSPAGAPRLPTLVEDLPVAVADGLLYLPLVHYGRVREQLVYLHDAGAAARYTGQNSVDLGLEALSRCVPLRVEHYGAFLRLHPRFLILGARTSSTAWLLPQLQSDGARVECISACGAADASPILLATLPAASH